ncbi:glycosyltransferase family 4 protein [Streptomyces sp. NPDC058691]|uniref:glycosyltransferase family 4 protein n=1 Tax=Streptomyces sp. NPDC058691 TaxID=3346601 RepID=UPI0036644E5F
MHIAVFTESPVATGIAAALRGADPAGEHIVTVVLSEAAGRAGWADGGEPPAHRLFRAGEPVGPADLAYETGARLRRFAEDNGVDRIVLLDDQTPCGSQVVRAVGDRFPVVLVQDRPLDFRYRDAFAARRAHALRWGNSAPSAVCVWGPSTYRALTHRSWSQDLPAVVTGAPGLSDDPELLRVARLKVGRRASEPGTPLRVLVLDELTDAAEALRSFGEVEEAKELPESDELSTYDFVVAARSAVWPAVLRAGVPLAQHMPEDLNELLPMVKHSLIRNTASVDDLLQLAMRLKVDGVFAGNPTGEPVEHFLSFGDDCAERVLRAVLDAALVTPQVPAALAAAPVAPAARVVSPADRALEDIRARMWRPRSLAVLGTDFGYVTGVALPVLTYTQDLISRGTVDVRYLDIGAFANAGAVLDALKGAERIMINGFGFFWRHWLGNRVARALLDSGIEVSVYVHVTQYIFEKEAAARSDRHEGLLDLLPRLRLLCVSQAQADYYRKQGAVDPLVVYNTVPRDAGVRRARPEVSAEPRIVMVGTVQDRKGADLFSRVAERAAVLGLPWRFSWLGHRMGALSDRTLLSDQVEWRGALPRKRIREELADADVLFLSSEDDPMPLAAVEAVQQRLRVVSHHGIGTHEMLCGVRGYRGFSEYTPEAALAALGEVLGDPVDEQGYAQIQELFDITRFAERMDAALGIAGTGGPAEAPTMPLPSVSPMADRTPGGHLAHVRGLVEAGRVKDALRYGNAALKKHPILELERTVAELREQDGA